MYGCGMPSQRFTPICFRTLLTPKSSELVATPYRFDGSREKAREFFETGFRNGMKRLRAGQDQAFPLTLYYAFKQAETKRGGDRGETTVSTGWETMLTGVIEAGFTVRWHMAGANRVGRQSEEASGGARLLHRTRLPAPASRRAP